LWAWLKHVGDAMWNKVTEGNYDKLKGDAFIRADVTNPGNGLRHSAVSYHMAAFKNPGLSPSSAVQELRLLISKWLPFFAVFSALHESRNNASL
jgi:hypothetical protein